MTASLLPPRGALTRGRRLQRRAPKPVTIPGAQLGPRDITRELYRQVCHFVGSVTSPLLLNVALHGMEQALGISYTPKGVRRGIYAVVRYADGTPVQA